MGGDRTDRLDDPAMDPVLEIEDLRTEFGSGEATVRAVNGVSLRCSPGRTLAVVGESGSGKSMTFLSVMGVLPNNARIASGRILFNGEDLLRMPRRTVRALRGRRIAMVFQDSLAGLNPAFTIGRQVADIFRHHMSMGRREAWRHAVDVLEKVRLPDAGVRARYYPHQLSGGMRQRVMIAMGIALNPDVLIADEPTTALDVTIQAQILDLLDTLRQELGVALVIITHDLGVVARYADEVAVMYAGRVVEYGSIDQVFSRPRHPYTLGLQRSIPRPDVDSEALVSIPGQPPSVTAVPSGCAFHPRCFHSEGRERCRTEVPALRHVFGQRTACHFAEELHAPAEQGTPP